LSDYIRELRSLVGTRPLILVGSVVRLKANLKKFKNLEQE